MSSILDALRKIEAAAQPPVAAQPVAARERRWTVHLAVGAVVLAFGTGAALALWFGSRSAPVKPIETAAVARPAGTAPEELAPAPPPEEPVAAPPQPGVAPAEPVIPSPQPVTPPQPPDPAPAAEAAPAPVAGLPAAAPAPPPVLAALEADPPRGRVATAPPPAAPAVASRAEPPARAAEAPPEAAAPEVEEPAPPVQDPSLLPRLPAGAPHVLVNVLLYSRLPERRTVSLTIDGGNMVTLREGESLGNIEVTRILPERIHVRYDGRLFGVDARE